MTWDAMGESARITDLSSDAEQVMGIVNDRIIRPIRDSRLLKVGDSPRNRCMSLLIQGVWELFKENTFLTQQTYSDQSCNTIALRRRLIVAKVDL